VKLHDFKRLYVLRLGVYRKWVCLLYWVGHGPRYTPSVFWKLRELKLSIHGPYHVQTHRKSRPTGFATLDIDAIWRGNGPLYYCTSCRLGSCRGWLQSPRGQLMVRSFCSTELESWVSISKPMCYATLFLSFQGHHMPGVPRTLARSSVSLQPNNSS